MNSMNKVGGGSVPVAPSDRFYVELTGGKYREMSKGGIHLNTFFSRGENAEVTGVIASVPRRGGIPGIKKGDQIFFSYLVVYDEEVIGEDNDEVFYEDEQEKPTMVSWSNKLGVRICREYCMNDRYRGIKLSPEGVIVDVVEGNFSKIESWIELHKFREGAGCLNKNALQVDGRDYWSVPTDLVYAVKRGKKIECIPGYLLCSVPEKKMVVQEKGVLTTVDFSEDKAGWISVLVSSPQNNTAIGKEVYVKLHAIEPYSIWGAEYMLVREDQVLAVREGKKGHKNLINNSK